MGKPGAAAATVAIMLTGCAAQGATEPTPAPTPTETVSVNAEPCREFAAITSGLGYAFQDESTKDDWEAIRTELDKVALRADGDVKTRLGALVEQWPSYADVVIYDGRETTNELIESVGRACEADDLKVTYYTFDVN